MTRSRRLLPLVCLTLAACSSSTGVLWTIDGAGLQADQLRLSATGTAVATAPQLAPATASAPLPWPQTLFAAFDVQAPMTTSLRVDALLGGVLVATAESMPVDVTPGRVFDGEVALVAPALDGGTPPPSDLAEPGAPDLAPPPPPTYAATVLADSPAAYWRLVDSNTVAVDATGAHNGVWGDNVTHATAGLVTHDASAAQFPGSGNGTSQTVTAPGAATLQPAQTLSIELWLLQTAGVDNDGASLVLYDAGANNTPPYQLYVDNGKINFELGQNAPLTAKSTLAGGAPHHVVATSDGSTMSLYLDGALDNTQSTSGAIDYSKAPFTLAIGAAASANASWSKGYKGVVGEVAIYTHVLAAARIAIHHTVGSSP